MLRNIMRFLYKNFNNFVKKNLKNFIIQPFKFDVVNLEKKILGKH